jgi:hypothetical protein
MGCPNSKAFVSVGEDIGFDASGVARSDFRDQATYINGNKQRIRCVQPVIHSAPMVR